MDVLISLAAQGDSMTRVSLRRSNWSGEPPSIDVLERSDKAGLLERWLTPSRQWIVALNAHHPLAPEINALLRALGESFTTRFRERWPHSVTRRPESLSERTCDSDLLFTSLVRTRSLVTLEMLGGSINIMRLANCAPGVAASEVKNAIRFYRRQGVLRNEDGLISFEDEPWMPSLRNLLNAYLKQRPEIARAVEALAAQEQGSRQSRMARRGIVGPASVERILTSLAINGSMRYSELAAATKTMASGSLGLSVLEDEGIVVSRRARPKERYVSLNAGHPVFPELLALLSSLSGQRRGRNASDMIDAEREFTSDRLLWDPLRTAVLLAIEATEGGEIDASTMMRRLPEKATNVIQERLRALQHQEILVVRHWKSLKLYSFNPEHPYIQPLRTLLRAANRVWPDHGIAASLDSELAPVNRIALGVGKGMLRRGQRN